MIRVDASGRAYDRVGAEPKPGRLVGRVDRCNPSGWDWYCLGGGQGSRMTRREAIIALREAVDSARRATR